MPSFAEGLSRGLSRGMEQGVQIKQRQAQEDRISKQTDAAMKIAGAQEKRASTQFDDQQKELETLRQSQRGTQNDYTRSQTFDALYSVASSGNLEKMNLMLTSKAAQDLYGTDRVEALNPRVESDKLAIRNWLTNQGVTFDSGDEGELNEAGEFVMDNEANDALMDQIVNDVADSNLLFKEADGSVIALDDMIAGTGAYTYMPPEARKLYEERQLALQTKIKSAQDKAYAPGTIEKDMGYMKKLFPDMSDDELFEKYNAFKNPPKVDKPPAAIAVDQYKVDKANKLTSGFYERNETTIDDWNPSSASNKQRQEASTAAAAVDKALDIKWSAEEEKTMRSLATAANAAESIATNDPRLQEAGFADNLYNTVGGYLGFGDQTTGREFNLIKNQLGHALYGSQFTSGEQARMTETYGNLWQADETAARGMLSQLRTLKAQVDTIKSKSPESFNLRYGDVSARLDNVITAMSAGQATGQAPKQAEPLVVKGVKMPEIGGMYSNQEVVARNHKTGEVKLADGTIVKVK